MITKEYLQQELVKRIDGYKRGVETSTDNIIAEMKSILVLVDALPDYEKKYNEALKWMRELYPGLHGAIKEDAEHYFPELRESEDERIRKAIIELLKEVEEDETYTGRQHIPDMLAYLEKQKEQKPEDKEITLTNFEEVLNTFLFDFANSPIEDCEPKEYTKKYSAEILKAAYAELNAQLKQDIFEAQQEGRREGYEAAKAEQKPAEWSEEDEDMLNSCISSIEEAKENRYAYKKTDGDTSYDHEIAWLKSIRPSWKPSEEQMKVFQNTMQRLLQAGGTGKWYAILESLYEDLKRL